MTSLKLSYLIKYSIFNFLIYRVLSLVLYDGHPPINKGRNAFRRPLILGDGTTRKEPLRTKNDDWYGEVFDRRSWGEKMVSKTGRSC